MRKAPTQYRDEKHMLYTVHSDRDHTSHRRKNACIYTWESWKRKRRKCLWERWTAQHVACGFTRRHAAAEEGSDRRRHWGVWPCTEVAKILESPLTWPVCCLALSVHTEASDPPRRHIPNISELKQNFSCWNIDQGYTKSTHIGPYNTRNAYLWQQCSLWRRAGEGRGDESLGVARAKNKVWIAINTLNTPHEVLVWLY